MKSWFFQRKRKVQFMNYRRFYLCTFSVVIAVIFLLKFDSYYEKKLLISFLKTQGVREPEVIDSHLRRNLFWIHNSDWKMLAGPGDPVISGKLDFDSDIIHQIPPSFGDGGRIDASWRERFEEKDFYCCRSGEFIYVCIFHY